MDRVMTLLERERDKLSKERDLIIRFMKSPNFDVITPQNPRPENYGLELARVSNLIKRYDGAIQSLSSNSEIELMPGSIIHNYLDLDYSICNYWEGIEAYITKKKGRKEELGLYVAIPVRHPWYNKPEFSEEPLSVLRLGEWALYQMKIRNYKDKKKQKTHSHSKMKKFIAEAVYAKGYREK